MAIFFVFGICIVSAILYGLFFWYPTYMAQEELRKYFESDKEMIMFNGGILHDAEFRSAGHRILVTFPKPAKSFTKEEAGKIMIQNIDGEYFHLSWKDVPEPVKRFWRSCGGKQWCMFAARLNCFAANSSCIIQGLGS